MGHIVMGLHMISDTLSIPACLSFAVFCPNENTALMSSYQGGALCFKKQVFDYPVGIIL